MKYQINQEPLYDYETLDILSYIVNGKTIKTDMDDIIERRGNRYKSVATQFFKNSIALEKHIKKNINYNMPGYESNGRQLAEFMFKEREGSERCFAAAIFYYKQLAEAGIDNKGMIILGTLDENCYLQYLGTGELPTISTASEFFVLLEELSVDDNDKYDALRLYHNFDLYKDYCLAIFAQVKELIKEHMPKMTDIIAPLMSRLNTDIAEIVKENFNIVLDDKNEYRIYPGIYKVNSGSLQATGFTEYVNFIMGIHILELSEMSKNAQSDSEGAEAFLKCLSDNTKLNILKLLKDGPMYGSQLAEKLNCTGANISHHASTLLSLGVVRFEKENNRIYMHLDRKRVMGYIDDLKELF